MKTILLYIQKLFCGAMLLWAEKPTSAEKFQYYYKLVLSLGVVAWALDSVGFWFEENKLFFRGLLIAIALNMYYGYKLHKKTGDFRTKIFWKKNCEMWLILVSVYPLLEVLYMMAGENYIAETFKLLVQVSTILYPGGKALKNAYIYSNKEYPPGFIMERIYDFEKSGDVKKLFGKEEEENNENL